VRWGEKWWGAPLQLLKKANSLLFQVLRPTKTSPRGRVIRMIRVIRVIGSLELFRGRRDISKGPRSARVSENFHIHAHD
jgi:hypothetical protein